MSAMLEETQEPMATITRSSIEIAVSDFIGAGIAVADPGSPLEGVIAHYTPNDIYINTNGITIFPHTAMVSVIAEADPTSPDGMQIKEYGGHMRMVAYAKVLGTDPRSPLAHANAREIADQLYKAASKLFYMDPSIGNYFKPTTDDINQTYSRVLRAEAAWDSNGAQLYECVVFELAFNEMTADLAGG